ncbi:septum site-determining protein MinC [Thiorhodococcus mannitoliphagus]|uniref:Probable septum site-determining protein MinC n=1 Tax=Thiorhodococcus mannitoliphagus TaxID=329406 RepID=A0A6P1DPG5_9GAMM|nr:septum site-determining protein MinC [Thiorhodococcus mannitoliphagus]NEX19043.1 septum site-determining protein MinC [Thiorhodococcus mannitoliphagus]
MAVKSSPQKNDADGSRSFELKAASFTLPIIRLVDNNVEAVAARLGKKVEKAPDFFRNTPVVIDLSELEESGSGGADLPLLVGLLRGYGMIPFGVRGGSKAQNAAAEALELAVLRESYVKRDRPKEDEPAEAEPRIEAGVSAESTSARRSAGGEDQARRSKPGFLLITKPVRSGQRVYAAGGDLSITAAVSSGAELMADGNIHVYGPLRGRALAGMSGNLEARIFCQDLQAELVSIAGHYRVSENIPTEMRGVPVQIFLDQKVLRIEKL